MKTYSTLIITTCILLTHSQIAAQGITRSSGIGLRLSYWKMYDAGESFSVVSSSSRQSVNLDGFGLWLYFFSRVHNNWFMELSVGTIGRVDIEQDLLSQESVDVDGVIPFLFGVRYDLFPSRMQSKFQPYLTAGGGSYWSSSVSVRNDIQTGDEVTSTTGEVNLGFYTGGGVNLVLSDWAMLNMDLRYHFVDFSAGKGLSGPEFSLGMAFMWGKKREIFRVKETKVIVKDIYPAYYQFYSTYPLALVTVQNTAGFPIEVNVSCRVYPYSVRPKESGFIRLERGEVRDIPATAVFGPSIIEVSSREPAVLQIEVEGKAGEVHKQEINAQLVVHTRNAWNGEIDKLGFFVTPDDPGIILLSRRLVKTDTASAQPASGNLEIARKVFNELSGRGIQYQTDPNIPFYKDDRVQYASETLELGSGDCDDLVVLYASLLESLGINTAFVQVQDPEKSLAHLYLIFDSGLPAEQGHLISSNEKRYVIREEYSPEKYFSEKRPGENRSGEDHLGEAVSGSTSLWIPVETTLITRGFEEAWKAGALQYLEEALVRGGLAEGWVQVIDID